MDDFETWRGALLAPKFGGVTPSWAHSREAAYEVWESMQSPQPKQVKQTDELFRLRRENADLKRRVARLEKLTSPKGALVRGIAEALRQRIGEVEQRGADRSVTLPSAAEITAATRTGPAMHDCGVWRPDRHYHPGDTVTAGNGLWIATIASKGLRPGDNAGWRLAFKTEQGFLRRAVREEVARQIKEPVIR